MADDVDDSEGNITICENGIHIVASPESQNLACKQRYIMNTGDPVLHNRLKKMGYRPSPVNQIWIPKDGQAKKQRL